jgi:disulfide bond formation protein DsbB
MRKYSAYAAWAIALASMLGSLYFSEIARIAPCSLCWYQRIAMYPLVFILPIAIIHHDAKIRWYILPLAIIGAIIGLYHNLLSWGIIEEIVACAPGLSCAIQQIHWFGFITIPLLSFLSFIAIIILILIYKPDNHEQGN